VFVTLTFEIDLDSVKFESQGHHRSKFAVTEGKQEFNSWYGWRWQKSKPELEIAKVF